MQQKQFLNIEIFFSYDKEHFSLRQTAVNRGPLFRAYYRVMYVARDIVIFQNFWLWKSLDKLNLISTNIFNEFQLERWCESEIEVKFWREIIARVFNAFESISGCRISHGDTRQ